ncbi:MAG: glycosyltransferase family 2 protein [Cyanobacteria bacterium]|nr:glycosyltransferase family 2 protein [Cyanobacteriota bacterium]
MPRVSIVTPFRNAARFLPGYVANLRRQSCDDWECLAIDDGSSDGGAGLLERCVASDRRFRLLRLPEARPGSTPLARLPARPRNHGLAHVLSPLVAFLDIDDLWHPRKLERQLAFHAAGQLDLSVTAYGRFRSAREPLLALRCPPAQLSAISLADANPIPLLTVLVRTELLAGGFPTIPHEDYLLWMNLQRRQPGLRFGSLPELLAFYRLHQNNQSGQPLQVAGWTYNLYRQYGLSRTGALTRLGRWGLGHLRRQWQERQQQATLPCGTQSVESLLAAQPLRLVTASA